MGPVPGTPSQSIVVEVSFGELVDKITILRIKDERIAEAEKRENVRAELETLRLALEQAGPHPAGVTTLEARLKEINEELWDIEDRIRICEKNRDFGTDFIALARAVYVTNDRRAATKRELNELVGSRLVEEKSYVRYAATG